MTNCREGLTTNSVLLVLFLLSATAMLAGVATAASEQEQEQIILQSVRVSHLASTGRCEEAVNAAEAMPSRDAATELLVGKCSV
ncbi:MAG: hypothetical protein ACI9QQ_002151, partial [Myxococcota bacterium]